MFDNREIIEFCDVVTYFAEKQYQNDEEKNGFFNSFISRVVLFDDCVYIFYNTSPNTPTKVKLDKSDLTALREYRTNRKSTLYEPLGFKLGACGGGWGIRTPVGLRPNGFQVFEGFWYPLFRNALKWYVFSEKRTLNRLFTWFYMFFAVICFSSMLYSIFCFLRFLNRFL